MCVFTPSKCQTFETHTPQSQVIFPGGRGLSTRAQVTCHTEPKGISHKKAMCLCVLLRGSAASADHKKECCKGNQAKNTNRKTKAICVSVLAVTIFSRSFTHHFVADERFFNAESHFKKLHLIRHGFGCER